MRGASPAPAREQWILVHVRRRDAEEEYLKDEEARLLKLEPAFHIDEFTTNIDRNPDTPQTNAWYVIKETNYTVPTPRFTEVFRSLPQDTDLPVYSRTGSGCVMVGSYLYDIGGYGSKQVTEGYWSNQIRRLDTKNPDDGWKVKQLPAYCPNPTTAVFGNFFPSRYWFKTVEECNIEEEPWAYLYDTSEETFCELKPPDGCEYSMVSCCVSVKGKGVILPIEDKKNGRHGLYLHKSREMIWQKIECGNPTPFSDMCSIGPFAVSNGILYVFSRAGAYGRLNTYEIKSWNYLRTIKVPNIEDLDIFKVTNIFIIPLGASELCFMWHNRPYEYRFLYYAKISVSTDPRDLTDLSATSLMKVAFCIDSLELLNCLPYSCLSDDQEKADDDLPMGEAEVSELVDASSKKRKRNGVDR